MAPPTTTTAKKVRDLSPIIAPIIMKRGSNRLKGRFLSANAGGIPKIQPNLFQPITTSAERKLFESLAVEYRTGKKIDFKGMMGAFNLKFSIQMHQPDHAALEPDMMIFPKSAKHLKKYHEQQQHAGRVRENTLFNAALSSLASPPLPSIEQSGTQLTLKETMQMQKRKAVASASTIAIGPTSATVADVQGKAQILFKH